MHHYIGIVLGAIVSYSLLLLFHGGRFVSDPNSAYMVAVSSGAIVAALWPWLLGLWLARRLRARQRARVQSEVSRQIAKKQDQPPTH
ncbi:hypothetical protein [Rivibacter subsaxonicus]|uniref:Uncharacterized protein n=1 Tax=Rivibacter subsaxonicus TaxID=457575 RepID=A0A4Q7VNL0_9BURK|nr:hypothetical protein [Rivibacter subsaxonicus]RZT97902.1 hypothetical protein EV670_2302 [Rivibacter subsaxonicus]